MSGRKASREHSHTHPRQRSTSSSRENQEAEHPAAPAAAAASASTAAADSAASSNTAPASSQPARPVPAAANDDANDDDEDDSDWNPDDDGDDAAGGGDESGAADAARIFSSILRQIGGDGAATAGGAAGGINQSNIQAILQGLAAQGLLHQDEDGNLIMMAGDDDEDDEDGIDVDEGDEGEEKDDEDDDEAAPPLLGGSDDEDAADDHDDDADSMEDDDEGDGESAAESKSNEPDPIQRDDVALNEYALHTHLAHAKSALGANGRNILHSLRSFEYNASIVPSSHLSYLSSPHIPSVCSAVEEFDGRAFCGKFSRGSEGGAESMFATATQDGLVHLYHTDSWRKYKEIQARSIGWSIVDIDFSADSRFVIYSSWSNCVHLINTQGEFELHEALDFEPSGPGHSQLQQHCCMFGIRFSPNGSREILAGLNNGIAMLFDIERKRKVWSARAHEDDINSVCWLDDGGNLFATGSDDSSIKIFDRRILANSDEAGGESEQQHGTGVGLGSGSARNTGNTGTNSGSGRYARARNFVGGFLGHLHGITCVSSLPDGNARYVLSNSKDQSMKL